MIRCLSAAALLFAAAPLSATAESGTGMIEGLVRDKETKAPIAGATVALNAIRPDYKPGGRFASSNLRTDDKGMFRFEDRADYWSDYRFYVVVCKEGYVEYPQGYRDSCEPGRPGPTLEEGESPETFERRMGVFALRENQVTRVVIELERCDAEGRIEFRSLPPGAGYEITLSSNGYVRQTLGGVTVVRNQVTEIAHTLRPTERRRRAGETGIDPRRRW